MPGQPGAFTAPLVRPEIRGHHLTVVRDGRRPWGAGVIRGQRIDERLSAVTAGNRTLDVESVVVPVHHQHTGTGPMGAHHLADTAQELGQRLLQHHLFKQPRLCLAQGVIRVLMGDVGDHGQTHRAATVLEPLAAHRGTSQHPLCGEDRPFPAHAQPVVNDTPEALRDVFTVMHRREVQERATG